MHHHSVLLLALLSAYVNALNINLGAYSPALVVGDGEISFGGKQDVSNLMTALEGAAVNNAAANGAAAPGVAAAVVPQTQAAVAPVAQPEAEVAAAAPAPAPEVVPGQAEQATAFNALQGMGKDIAPRLDETPVKRDLAGFNAALKYASDALKTAPGVQLGTGAEGSGVGIKQEPGSANPQAAAAKAEKRDESAAPKTTATVTRMYIRGGPRPDAASIPVGKRALSAPSAATDALNLNMAEGQVAELTIVETRSSGDEE